MSNPGGSDLGLTPALGAMFVALLTGCADKGAMPPAVTRHDSAGVELVGIQGELEPLGWAHEERFVLGGARDGPEAFFEVNASLVDADPTGNLFVLDPTNHRIVRFSAEGRVLGVLGRAGQGPGELGQPFAIAVAEDNVIVVADRSRRNLQRLTADGSPLEPVEIQAPIYGAAELTILGTTPVFLWWQWTGRSSGISQVVWGEGEPRVVAQMPIVGAEDQRTFPSCPQGFPGAKYLDPGLVWATSGAGLVATTTHEYRIQVFSPRGELVRVIRREVDRDPVTSDVLMIHMEDPFMANVGRGPNALCPVPLEEAIRIKGYLDSVPAITALAISDEGEIWARRGAVPFEAGEIDVYDARGEPLGTLPGGTPFPVAFTPTGTATARDDGNGIQRLVVWRIYRRGS